ncbi:MAG: ankyrin repeat domain-containing protein, partial [Phycisphaerales bacterium]|nr:ankyrin repeat domain-containing protein [Phycisphaerales bacterium]
AGADIRSRSFGEEMTVLMAAVMSNQIARVVKTIIAYGVDINACIEEGWTALMMAARFAKDSNIVHLLIDKGADRAAINDQGKNARDYIPFNDHFGESEKAELLAAFDG